VNCRPRSNFLYIVITVYFYLLIYIPAYYYLLPLYTLNSLFIANRWDWQPHRKLGAKFLVVLCAGSTLLLVQSKALDEAPYILSGAIAKLAGTTFWSLAFSYWFDKPWFHNWGKTCCCAHHTFLLGFPTGCNLYAISTLHQTLEPMVNKIYRNTICHHAQWGGDLLDGAKSSDAIPPLSNNRLPKVTLGESEKLYEVAPH
jgi:hypothetical protein